MSTRALLCPLALSCAAAGDLVPPGLMTVRVTAAALLSDTSLTKVVAMMTKKVKSLRWDVEREQAIYATHAHRVISIALKPRGDRGAPGPQGPIGNTVSVTRAALGRGVTVAPATCTLHMY